MEASCREFVETLTRQSASLDVAYREVIEYWKPSEPPVTILFAALGEKIVIDFDCTDKEIMQELFWIIENGMESGKSVLVTAVATGLIEAMIAKSQYEEGLWQRISPLLGELSRRHADAWLAF